MRKIHLFLLGLSLLAVGCDKLDDGDDAIMGVLPGTWLFSYELLSEVETGLNFQYDRVVFRADGTCSITYPDGSMEGTYRAGSSVIRIEGESGGEQRTMLWRVKSFTKKQVVAEYEFEYDEQSVTAIVTLDRDDE